MNNKLETLRPEVREAMHRLKNYLHFTIDGKHFRSEDYDTIRAELLRLAGECVTLSKLLDSARMDRIDEFRHANKAEAELEAAQNTINAQQDMMGAMKRKLALSEGELAAFKERIAAAPVVTCLKTLVHAGNTIQTELLEYTHECMPGGCNRWAGKRVRLVVEE